MEPPAGNPGNPDVSREDIIDTYIKTLAQVVGGYGLPPTPQSPPPVLMRPSHP